MFWDITNDALDSSESLVKVVYDSWVLDEDLATIRERSSLTNETIIGGDGVIGPLPLLDWLFIDELLARAKRLILNDISSEALARLQSRIGAVGDQVQWFHHDMSKPMQGRVVRVVDQKTAVVPLHADTLADPNKLLASIRSLVDLA